jgi:hypothetical protein
MIALGMGLMLVMMQVPGAACAPCGPIETWNQTTVSLECPRGYMVDTPKGLIFCDVPPKPSCDPGWTYDPARKVCKIAIPVRSDGKTLANCQTHDNGKVLVCEMPAKESK